MTQNEIDLVKLLNRKRMKELEYKLHMEQLKTEQDMLEEQINDFEFWKKMYDKYEEELF